VKRRVVWLCLVLLAALALLHVPPAFASTSQIGRNVGDEVRSWATALLFGVAAIVGIPIIFKRDVSGGLVLALLVIVVGGFVFAPTVVRLVIRALWNAIGG
jgi:hypothetical protein